MEAYSDDTSDSPEDSDRILIVFRISKLQEVKLEEEAAKQIAVSIASHPSVPVDMSGDVPRSICTMCSTYFHEQAYSLFHIVQDGSVKTSVSFKPWPIVNTVAKPRISKHTTTYEMGSRFRV